MPPSTQLVDTPSKALQKRNSGTDPSATINGQGRNASVPVSTCKKGDRRLWNTLDFAAEGLNRDIGSAWGKEKAQRCPFGRPENDAFCSSCDISC